MQAIGVFTWIHALKHEVLIDAFGQWQLNDVTRARWVSVESGNMLEDQVLGCVGGQIYPDRFNADLFAVTVFAGDIRMTAWVITDQHSSQARGDPSSTQRVNAGAKFVFDLSRDGFAVKNRCRHGPSIPRVGCTYTYGSVVRCDDFLCTHWLLAGGSQRNCTASDRDTHNK